jgi:NADPH2:quinone reductase
MRAVEISQAGGPEVLRPVRRPKPAPAPGDVLIRVAAAGVNGHDLHQRHDGTHPIRPGESDLPGLEVAGVVEAVGEGVDDLKAGDAVCALLRGGGYAEYATARAAHCLPAPRGLSWVEAASLPETCFTVWSNVFIEARLQPGERFLMNGGSSGIGVTAIQIARRLGAEVYATAGGPEKVQACRDLGAQVVADYRTEDFVEVIRRATDGQGVDVILDIVGGDYLPGDIEILRLDGRLILIGVARGATAEIDFMPVVRKRLVLTGSTLRPRSDQYKAKVAQDLRERVWPLYESGQLRPVVHGTFPLEEAASAHALMEARSHTGKVVLTVDTEVGHER